MTDPSNVLHDPSDCARRAYRWTGQYEREACGGEAVVRTVAHGVQPWEIRFESRLEPASAGERAGARTVFFRPLKRAHEIATSQNPQLNAGGYGSYGGFTADPKHRVNEDSDGAGADGQRLPIYPSVFFLPAVSDVTDRRGGSDTSRSGCSRSRSCRYFTSASRSFPTSSISCRLRARVSATIGSSQAISTVHSHPICGR